MSENTRNGLPSGDAAAPPAGHDGALAAQVTGLTPSQGSPDGASTPNPGSTPDGYVAGSGYWQGSDIPADDAEGFDYLGTVLQARGVRQPVGNAAVDWLYSLADIGDTLHTQAAAHTYDLSRYHFSGEDAAIANHFANAMHKAGASQEEVQALLDVYEDGQRRAAKREARDAGKSPVERKPIAELGLEDIRQIMRVDRKRYNGDEAMQARYRALIAAGSK